MLYYTDNTPVSGIREKCQMLLPKKESTGKFLPASCITDSVVFEDLYNAWIIAAANVVYTIKYNKKSLDQEHFHKVHDFFSPQTQENEEDEKNFLEDCKFALVTTTRLCKASTFDQIKADVTKNMEGRPFHMQLRVIFVCMLLDRLPQDVFGQNCYNQLNPIPANEIQVKDGDGLKLDFRSPEKYLVESTLFNPKNEKITLNIDWDGKKHPLQMPPYGRLRVLFSDSASTRLVGIKGNISIGDSGKMALIQDPAERSAIVRLYMKNFAPHTIWNTGSVWDASTDGAGGCFVREPRELIRTSTGEQRIGSLPIRCYGAGRYYALLYTDGHIESNLFSIVGKEFRALSVVEYGDAGFLIHDGTNCWKVQGVGKKMIDECEFVQAMLGRFSEGGCCELVQTQLAGFCIGLDGKVTVR